MIDGETSWNSENGETLAAGIQYGRARARRQRADRASSSTRHAPDAAGHCPTWYEPGARTGSRKAPKPAAEPGTRAAESVERRSSTRGWPRRRARSFEAGRERGRQEGRQAEREAQAAAQARPSEQRARQVAGLVESFAQERDRYLHAVEQEVVKLALAVAARILRREAQMDPLLLTGAVRVALGQLAGSTEVRLRVPAAELDLWTEAIALLPNLAVKPRLLAGEGMRAGRLRDRDRAGHGGSGNSLAAGRDRARLLRPRRQRAGRSRRGSGRRQAGYRPEVPRDDARCWSRYFARLERGQPWRWRGQVLESVGQTIESAGPLASVGECCEIRGPGWARCTWPK